MNYEQKLARIRALTNLVVALESELRESKSRTKAIQAEIRSTEAERDELITSTEHQTAIPGFE